MQSFVIDRETWLRGEGGSLSYLLRPSDDKQCCVGIYLEQVCNISREKLSEIKSATYMVLEECGNWLLSDGWNSKVADNLYRVNDDQYEVTPEAREAEITKLFASAGVEVTFINQSRKEPSSEPNQVLLPRLEGR